MIHKIQTVCGVFFTIEDYLKASEYKHILETRAGYLLLKPCEKHTKHRETCPTQDPDYELAVQEGFAVPCNCQEMRVALEEYDECEECDKIETGVFYNEEFPEDEYLSYQDKQKLSTATKKLRFMNVPHDQIDRWSKELGLTSDPGYLGVLAMKVKNTCPTLEDLTKKEEEVAKELIEIMIRYPLWQKICGRKIRFFALQDDCRCCS